MNPAPWVENASQTGLFIKLLSKKMMIQRVHTQGLPKTLLNGDIMDTQAALEIEMTTNQQPCHLLYGNSKMKTKTTT